MTTTTPVVSTLDNNTQSGIAADVLERAGDAYCCYIGQHPDRVVIGIRGATVAQRVTARLDAAMRIDEILSALRYLPADDRNAIALYLAVPLHGS